MRPTKNGWYFYKNPRMKNVEMVYVSGRKKKFATVLNGAIPDEYSTFKVDESDGQWAGPLEPPRGR